MFETKEQLNAQIKKLRRKLSAIEEREAKEATKHLVGKYFKYKNCYSCPKKPSDYWWLYLKVTKVSGAWVYSESFQTDKFNTRKFESNMHHHESLKRYTPISEKQYKNAYAKFKKTLP